MKKIKSLSIFMLLAVMLVCGTVTAYAETHEPPPTGEELFIFQEYEPEQQPEEPFILYSEPQPEPTFEPPAQTSEPETPPVADPPGRLLVHSRVESTGIVLRGTVFAVHRTFDNALIAELVTDIYGEAMLELPAGDYYIRKTAVFSGYILNTDRINFTVTAGAIRELTVFSRAEPIITPPPVPNPGRLVIINRAEGTGENLNGSLFYIFNAMNDQYITEVITNQFGEVSYNLTAGDYFLRQVSVMQGYILNTDRISFNIVSDSVRTVSVMNKAQTAATPTPTPTPQPTQVNEQPGRLVITKVSEGTRERLQGAVFEVINIMTDVLIAEIKTDRHGEASVLLSAGDYYLREITAPQGFQRSLERINIRVRAGQITEITVTNKPEQETGVNTSQSGSGRLLLFMQSEGTGVKLQGSVFAVHEAQYDMRIYTLTTDQFGEATVTLPAGDYYLRQIEASDGYILNSNRVNVRLTSGAVTEITVTAKTESTAPAPEQQFGRLLVTVRAENTGDKMQGVIFAVYHGLTDVIVGSLTTDYFGEASIQLPAGDYFIRQVSSADGYSFSTDRIPVRIADNAVRDISVTNKAVTVPTPQPTQTSAPSASTQRPAASAPAQTQTCLQLTARAEQSGNPMSGAVFGVYRTTDNAKIAELTTGADGKANYSLQADEYYLRMLRAPYGYLLDTARIFFTVSGSGTVHVDVTTQRDMNIPDIVVEEGIIFIPKTGEDFPLLNYILGTVLMVTAALCGARLIIFDKRKRRKRRTILDLA